MRVHLLCTYRLTWGGDIELVVKAAYASLKEARAEAYKRNRSPYYRHDYFVRSFSVKEPTHDARSQGQG